MSADRPSASWFEPKESFVLHKGATRARKTAICYEQYITRLSSWAHDEHIALDTFTKRHLDAYSATRADQGLSATTRHHDALCATVFFEWCKKSHFLRRDPLAEYKVRNAPAPPKYIPTHCGPR